MNTQIDAAIKRARGYWFVDGFTEMIAGILFILLAGILLISMKASQASSPVWLLSIAGEISIAKFFGILIAILVLWWLKDHFTYPRTGFVRGNRITATQALILIRNTILFLLLPIFGLITTSLLIVSAGSVLSSMPAWFPIGVSVIWASLCALAGIWMGLRRFQVVGALVLLAGIKVGLLQFAIGLPTIPENTHLEISQPIALEIINRTFTSLSFLILVSGVIFILSGALTFLRYRKENPTPYSEDV